MKNISILIVEDDIEINNLIAEAVVRGGCKPIQAFDGRQALQRFDPSSIKLVILDIMLPYMDGMEVLRRIRESSTVHIIMLSVKSEETDRIIGLGIGADDYMTKPFSVTELTARSLDDMLQGNYNQRIRMQSHNKPLSSEEKDRYLDIIQAKGFILYDLIETFFQLAKLEAEDVRLEIEAVNLSELIRQSTILLYHDFKRLEIEPQIDLPEQDVYVSGNREAVNRILDNLIGNSLKYGNDGKAIGIKLWVEEKHAMVEVWDKGQGISEEELPHLFDRLYTLEKSRNMRYQGSGLGLTIAKKLVQIQGGQINASSNPEMQTVFTFDLPIAKKL